MFTGIVEEIGSVDKLEVKPNLAVLRLKAHKVLSGTKMGDSLAVNGVCLTVTDLTKNTVTFDMMRETLLKTSLGQLRPGGLVNLERALKASDRLSGHVVTGHVDEMVLIKGKVVKPNYVELQIGLKKSFAPYIVLKGSVCLDGASLTVGEVRGSYFSVYLIPFTLKMTTLGMKTKGDVLNLETDILAKYVAGLKKGSGWN